MANAGAPVVLGESIFVKVDSDLRVLEVTTTDPSLLQGSRDGSPIYIGSHVWQDDRCLGYTDFEPCIVLVDGVIESLIGQQTLRIGLQRGRVKPMAKSLMDLVSDARARIAEIDVATLGDELSGSDLLLVDVREPDEYGAGRLPGAVLIPRGTIEPAADLQFPMRHPELSQARKRRVVLYCGSGGRSALACDVLQEMGFENVASLAGGIAAWKEAELAIEVDP